LISFILLIVLVFFAGYSLGWDIATLNRARTDAKAAQKKYEQKKVLYALEELAYLLPLYPDEPEEEDDEPIGTYSGPWDLRPGQTAEDLRDYEEEE
jgi:hypothetical protein